MSVPAVIHRPWQPGKCVYRPYTTELNVIYWYLWKSARQRTAVNRPFMSQPELARAVDQIIENMMESNDD